MNFNQIMSERTSVFGRIETGVSLERLEHVSGVAAAETWQPEIALQLVRLFCDVDDLFPTTDSYKEFLTRRVWWSESTIIISRAQ